MNLLAISGSLRAGSSNTTLVEAAIALSPATLEFTRYGALADLPAFNPDLDDEQAPFPAVQEFRARLRAADGVVISCPEYAHGVPGSFKNALDWVVGSGEFVDKPVALFQASARSTYALASLTETLTVMSAHLVEEAHRTVPLLGASRSVADLLADAEVVAALTGGIEAMVRTIEARRGVTSA